MNDSITAKADTSEAKQLIGFSVGNEEFGLELHRVKEVIRMREITWLPRAPYCVKGIINLRGEVIPVIDLRDRFRLPSIARTPATRIIVVEMESRPLGIIVDSASQVVKVPANQIDPAPQVMGKIAQELISGVGKLGEKLIVLIDVDSVLSPEELTKISDSLEKTARKLDERTDLEDSKNLS